MLESGEKGTLLHCWWECKLIQPLWRTAWRFLKKTLGLKLLFSSGQLSPTVCDPMDCSTPVSPVHHQPPELTQTHVHPVMMASNHLILCRPLLLLPSVFPGITSVTIYSDFGTPPQKWINFSLFPLFPHHLPWTDGTRCHDLCFLNVEF